MENSGHCLVCGTPLEQAIVWCCSCGTPHHEDCFSYAGRCAIYACDGMRFSRSQTEPRGVVWVERREPDGQLHTQAYIADFSSRREILCRGLARSMAVPVAIASGLALALVLTLFKRLLLLWFVPWFVVVIAFVVNWLGKQVFQDYWVVDAKTSKIWLHTQTFRQKLLTEYAGFAEAKELLMERVGIETSHDVRGIEYTSTWVLRLRFRGKGPIDLTDPVTTERSLNPSVAVDQPPVEVQQVAQRVASLLKVPIHREPPEEGQLPAGLGLLPSQEEIQLEDRRD